MVTSGLRLGTSAVATRGFTGEDFAAVADIVAQALSSTFDDEPAVLLRDQVAMLADKHPLYGVLDYSTGSASRPAP